MESNELTIPHPRLTERAFVLVPLDEIASDTVHPVEKKTIAQLLSALNDKSGVIKFEGGDQMLNRRRHVSGIS